MRTMPLSANEDRNLIANRAQTCSVKDSYFAVSPLFCYQRATQKLIFSTKATVYDQRH